MVRFSLIYHHSVQGIIEKGETEGKEIILLEDFNNSPGKK